MRESLIKMLGVTWEICGGKELSRGASDSMVSALEDYDPDSVGNALLRCQTECKGHVSLGDIVERIDDGRPGAEEAWAMVPATEDDSAVWTEEISAAFSTVRKMMEDDPVAARMSFRETYTKACAAARIEKRPVVWTFSPGFDVGQRQLTLLAAVDKKRITAKRAMELAPHLVEEKLKERGLLPPPPGETKHLPPKTAAKNHPEKELPPENRSKVKRVPKHEISAFIDYLSQQMTLRDEREDEDAVERKAIREENEQ